MKKKFYESNFGKESEDLTCRIRDRKPHKHCKAAKHVAIYEQAVLELTHEAQDKLNIPRGSDSFNIWHMPTSDHEWQIHSYIFRNIYEKMDEIRQREKDARKSEELKKKLSRAAKNPQTPPEAKVTKRL